MVDGGGGWGTILARYLKLLVKPAYLLRGVL